MDKAKPTRLEDMSFSKRLLLFYIVTALVLTALTIILAYCPEPDSGALTTMERLTEIWFGGTTAVTGFYLWKARSENRNKYTLLWYEKVADKYGWEAAAQFSEIVTKGE